MEMESDDESLYMFDPLEELITGRRHPLIEAARDGNYDRLTLLVGKLNEKELPLTMRDQSGWQAIHFAAKLSDTKCLSSLLSADSCLVHSVTREKISPLMVAAGEGNISAVNVLLPLLNHEQVFAEDLHGLNALYYAVSANSSSGNSIVHTLLERLDPGGVASLGCSSSFDSLPFKVAQVKNFEVLKAFLEAGLDPAYRCISAEESSVAYENSSLVNICIGEQWVAGVELVIKAQLKKHGGNICSVWELFTAGEFPALAMICDRGDLECLQLLIDNGVQVPCHNMTPSAVKFDTCRLLSSVVNGDIWKKQKFLRFFLVEETCSLFQQHLEQELLSVANGQEYVYQLVRDYYYSDLVMMDKMRFKHPLDAVVEAIEKCSDEHPVGDCVQLLLDCNLTFDFRLPMFGYDGLSWDVFIDRLFLDGYGRIVKTSSVLALGLMRRQNHLPITMVTVVMTYLEDCEAEGAIRHLAKAMEYLAARPIPELVEILRRCSVIGFGVQHIVTLHKDAGCEERPFQDSHLSWKDERHWHFTALLLLKGIRAQLIDNKDLFTTPVMPFSVLFLGDNERRRYFVRRTNHCKDQFELKLKMQTVSSLQSLCRTVIRNEIGAVRLFREPLPDITPPLVFAHRGSWEVSSVGQLGNLPPILKEFLRYAPELKTYTAYVDRCTAGSHQ